MNKVKKNETIEKLENIYKTRFKRILKNFQTTEMFFFCEQNHLLFTSDDVLSLYILNKDDFVFVVSPLEIVENFTVSDEKEFIDKKIDENDVIFSNISCKKCVKEQNYEFIGKIVWGAPNEKDYLRGKLLFSHDNVQIQRLSKVSNKQVLQKINFNDYLIDKLDEEEEKLIEKVKKNIHLMKNETPNIIKGFNDLLDYLANKDQLSEIEAYLYGILNLHSDLNNI